MNGTPIRAGSIAILLGYLATATGCGTTGDYCYTDLDCSGNLICETCSFVGRDHDDTLCVDKRDPWSDLEMFCPWRD